MTSEEKLNIEVDKRVGLIAALNKESTQTQILLEYQETVKTDHCINWLDSINKERKNPKVQDVIDIVRIRISKHKKVVSDLMHYEAKANYYEMLYKGNVSNKEQIKIMEELLRKIKLEKF